MKKPTPLRAFFDPVKMATSLNSAPSSDPATNFTALFELIFVRSFAMPDSACTAITNTTDTHSAHDTCWNVSAMSATTWSARPARSVMPRPVREPTQPPSRLVTMPMNSYARKRKASATGE